MKTQQQAQLLTELSTEYKNRIQALVNEVPDENFNLIHYLMQLKNEGIYHFAIWNNVWNNSYLMLEFELDEDWVCEFCDVMRYIATICNVPMKIGETFAWEDAKNKIERRHLPKKVIY